MTGAEPRRWTIVNDSRVRDEAFIPDSSPRSRRVLQRTIDAIESGEIVLIAASYLAQHDRGSLDSDGG